MKLLILTQKVDSNDDVLGFFHDWIVEFAKQYEKVSVICLWKGKYNLPPNVFVYSLGKELGLSKFAYIRNFYSYIFSLRSEYDNVFVHMNQIYVILGGIFWKLWNKRIGLWYVHRQTTLSLWIAEKITTDIFTAAKESFSLQSKKVHIVGHGIRLSLYTSSNYVPKDGTKILLQVGRITPIKNCDLAIDTLSILEKKYPSKYHLRFVGKPVTDLDKQYLKELLVKVDALGLGNSVTFGGPLPPKSMIDEYEKADATINLAPTGGIDKAVLESMASGRISFSTNEGFALYFSPFEKYLLLQNKPEDIAASIHELFSRSDVSEISATLKQTVIEKSSLEKLIARIATILQ